MDLPPGFALRPRTDADLGFLSELYAQSRAAELAPVPWPEERKRAFLNDQFCKQHAHYLQHYPTAQWWLVVRDGVPAGRLYLAQTPGELRIMDVTLVPGCRNEGAGTALMRMLISHADRNRLAITLHVEPFNPAIRLYVRLGFLHVETRGVYHFMRRPVSVEDDFVGGGVRVAPDGDHEQFEPSALRM
ncbi:GNAT family N-acetyltransferase [Caenimonas aquaedulcis]|uniref:GNAT family N-acetyltransferase n=1 Tax=Caenimonas aquaedulcis TaxID=2793270 RepID=A0A931MH47_9BURK|nr:GNAT family N-acetyltransferase [Caenimonas aquaedulcis]MBG9388414.1 GNAT family N-acetyltransferase [Caenimonas aquaedulcis]